MNFRQGKRVWLGLGLQGETSGRHELSPRKKGKVRVRGKVNLAVSRKRSVVEQNGIKISILWVQRGIEESFVGSPTAGVTWKPWF